MAWSAPPTWAVSEVVTAARMQILSDDLAYLHGDAGTVTIGADVAPTGIVATRNDGAYQFKCARSSAVARTYGFAVGGSDGSFGLDDVTAAARRMTIGTDGNFGFGGGVTTPRGRIHGYGSTSGFMHWDYDGVDGTARTVIPDGTGDVLYYATGLFQVRTSGGAISATGSTIGLITPGTDLQWMGGKKT